MAWGANRQGVEDLAARLAANDSTLTSLTLLSGRRLGHPEVIQLAEALRSNTALTQLTSCHPLAPPSAAVLAAAIAVHGRVTCLSVGDSTFGDAGLEALVPALRLLTVLDLEHKALSHVAAACLANVLGDSPPLLDLNLSRNSLGCVTTGAAARRCTCRSSSRLLTRSPSFPWLSVTTAPLHCARRWQGQGW